MHENDNNAQQEEQQQGATSTHVDDAAYVEPEVVDDSIETLTEDMITFGGEGNDNGEDQGSEDAGESASRIELQTESGQSTESQGETTNDGGEGGSDTSPESSSEEEGGASTSSDANTTEQASGQAETGQENDDTFRYLTEETGVEVTGIDQVVDGLKELAELRKGKGQTQNLSPAMQAALAVESAGGDLSEHFRRAGMDFENMDAQEVLRQKFFKDNAALHKSNPKLAQMKFERELRDKYGTYFAYNALKDETERQDFIEENGEEEIEFEKLMLESDSNNAKTELEEWKKTAAPDKPAQSTQTATSQPSQEEIDRINREYSEKAPKAFEDFEALSIPMGEGQKDFALGLNDKTRPIVESWVNNPYTFLNAIGFEDNNVDIERLIPVMTAIAELSEGTLGPRLKKYITDSSDIETLDKKIDKPKVITTDVVGEPKGDEWDQVADAAANARKKVTGA